MLSESLCAPIPLGDVNEKERESDLEQLVHTLRGWELSLMCGGLGNCVALGKLWTQ